MNKKTLTFHDYFNKELTYILVIFSILSVYGNAVDLFHYKDFGNLIILFNFFSIIIFSLLPLLLFKFKISIKVCFIIGVYTFLGNAFASLIFNPYNVEFLPIFLRETLFIALVLTFASIFISRINAIIISLAYIFFYIYVLYITDNKFLEDNTYLITIIFGVFAYVLYFFVGNLNKTLKSFQEQAQINEIQNEHLNKINLELEESRLLMEEKNEKLRIITIKLDEKTIELNDNNKNLINSNSIKDKLFSIITHDLKGSIGSFSGFLELLMVRYNQLTEENKHEVLQRLYKSSSMLYELLVNLLTWSKLQSNQLEIKPIKINVKNAIDRIINILVKVSENKNIEIEINIDDNHYVIADQMMFETIFRNLISNAIKFTSKNGKVLIQSEISVRNYITITVADNGTGIDVEKQKWIFDFAHKFSTPGTAGEIGTGLGLILCKEFTERNNGLISFESQVNKGTSFRLSLPSTTN